MKKLLTAKLLLLIYVFVFTSCSKDESVQPNPISPTSPESLATTKWNWVSWGDVTGDEKSVPAETPLSIYFIDGSNIEKTSVEDGQTKVIQFTYQISKDTLIAYETAEVNYFILKEHTATNLTLNRVKSIKRSTNEVATETGLFKYIKAAN